MMKTTCPSCGTDQELHGHIKDGRDVQEDGAVDPTPGSLSLCANCLSFSVFDESPTGMVRRKPSQAEWRDILGDETVMRVYSVAAMVRAHRR